MEIHICARGCVAFAGKYESLQACPTCKQPRFSLSGSRTPQRRVMYFPIIPRLIRLARSASARAAMQPSPTVDPGHSPALPCDILDGQASKNDLNDLAPKIQRL